MTRGEIEEELEKRIAMMREGASVDAETDQYRVYKHIIGVLESGNYLRLMVQASAPRLFARKRKCGDTSVCLRGGRCFCVCAAFLPRTHEAGTGKSFLLTTVYLWCLLKRKKVKAAAPWQPECFVNALHD